MGGAAVGLDRRRDLACASVPVRCRAVARRPAPARVSRLSGATVSGVKMTAVPRPAAGTDGPPSARSSRAGRFPARRHRSVATLCGLRGRRRLRHLRSLPGAGLFCGVRRRDIPGTAWPLRSNPAAPPPSRSASATVRTLSPASSAACELRDRPWASAGGAGIRARLGPIARAEPRTPRRRRSAPDRVRPPAAATCASGAAASASPRRRRSRSSHRRGARIHRAARRRSRNRPPPWRWRWPAPCRRATVRRRPSTARSSRTAASMPAERRENQRSRADIGPRRCRRRIAAGSLDDGAPDMVSLCWGSVAMVDTAARESPPICTIDAARQTDRWPRPPQFSTDRFAAETGAVLRRLFLLRRCPAAVFPALAGGEGPRCAHHRHRHRGSDAGANRRDPDHHPCGRPAPGAEGDAGDRRRWWASSA